jgi:hypothetical protein
VSVGVKALTNSFEALEHNQQFGANASTGIGKSRRLRTEGNTIINNVSAMRPGLAKFIEKVPISTYYETAETDLHITENACCIVYADTWTSKQVY